MAATLNPYAPPTAGLVPASADDCWRDGRLVVLRRGADLPHRCHRCNAPGSPPRWPRRFYWHTPWLYLLLINFLVYIVVALLVRRMVRLRPVLCPAHHAERWRYLALVAGLVVAGMGLIVNAVAPLPGLDWREGLLLAPLLFVAALVLAAWKLRALTTAGIDRHVVRLRGAGRPFLDSLPDYPGLTVPRD